MNCTTAKAVILADKSGFKALQVLLSNNSAADLV